jgi:hypothetical protein
MYLNRTYMLFYNKVLSGLLPVCVKHQYVFIESVSNPLYTPAVGQDYGLKQLYHDSV